MSPLLTTIVDADTGDEEIQNHVRQEALYMVLESLRNVVVVVGEGSGSFLLSEHRGEKSNTYTVISGFITASAIVIGLSQAKYLLGYEIDRSSKILPLVKSIIAGADKETKEFRIKFDVLDYLLNWNSGFDCFSGQSMQGRMRILKEWNCSRH
ncbi:hypothetical protein RJT34_04967 [Clitoria ternatea]|uniref:SLC26A/SulP transporter domain-containing protein n=1 Tax=Clitoria ternatea TaxID=43366 RepID=A0AAN9KPI2_CLITE